jgi:hypothetical protein
MHIVWEYIQQQMKTTKGRGPFRYDAVANPTVLTLYHTKSLNSHNTEGKECSLSIFSKWEAHHTPLTE